MLGTHGAAEQSSALLRGACTASYRNGSYDWLRGSERALCIFVCSAVILVLTAVSAAAEEAQRPLRVLVLPPNFHFFNISVNEYSAAENESEATRINAALVSATQTFFSTRSGTDLLVSAALDPSAAVPVTQWTLLSDAVMKAAWNGGVAGTGVWELRRRALDYTAGPALAPLMDKLSAPVALVISGENYYEPTSARALGNVASFFAPSPSHKRVAKGGYLFIGIFELATGQLLWLGGTTAVDKLAPDHLEFAERVVREALRDYPGGNWARPGAVFP